MPGRNSFNYSVIRVVPNVERQEFINAGIIVFCKMLDYLDCTINYQTARLKNCFPEADIPHITSLLKMIEEIVAGKDNIGYFKKLSKSERFNWLAAPSSTIIQASPIHSGICESPEKEMKLLYNLLVK